MSSTNNPTEDPTTLPLPTGAATEAKQDSLLAELQIKADPTEEQYVAEQNIGIAGTPTRGTVTLVNANQRYPVPTTAITLGNQIYVEFKGSGTFFLTSTDTGTAGTDGIRFFDGDVLPFVFENTVIYVASNTAGDTVEWTAWEVL